MAGARQKRNGEFGYLSHGWHRSRQGVTRRRAPQAHGGTSLRLERLESRQLLDAGMAGELLGATTAPDLEWLTYVGGGGDIDTITDVAVDPNGDFLIYGYDSSDAEQPTFITKMSPEGERMWTTRIGRGQLSTFSSRLAVDGQGNVVATGWTLGYSTDPWVSGGYDVSTSGLPDAFVVKLDSNGVEQWSTYTAVRKEGPRFGEDIAVDSVGDIFVVGRKEPFNASNGKENIDGFVLKISSDGQQPLWSKLIGGEGGDEISGIALDSSENLILAGTTDSDNSSGWISGPFDSELSGSQDVFVMKLNGDGDHEWSSYLGGSGDDGSNYVGVNIGVPLGVAVDADGNVLVAAQTGSTTIDGFDAHSNGSKDAFVAKLSPSGDGLWATFVGGDQDEEVFGMALGSGGCAYVAGKTYSAHWVSGGFDLSLDGTSDAYVAQISPDGDHVWSSYVGGANAENSQGIAVDPVGYAVVVGDTASPDLSTDGTTLNGTSDGFVAKIRLGPPAPPSFSIDDVEVLEGDSGPKTATFTVRRLGDLTETDTVEFATVDATATTGDNDYLPTAGTLTFEPDVATLPVTVTILGDGRDEGDETFLVNLSNPSSGASIADGSGIATILNDDALTSLYIADIRFESKRGGHDWRAVVEIHDVDGNAVAGVALKVDFVGETYDLTTDSDGVARTGWERNLPSGNYITDAYDLALTGYDWDPFTSAFDDSDGDGHPDEELVVV